MLQLDIFNDEWFRQGKVSGGDCSNKKINDHWKDYSREQQKNDQGTILGTNTTWNGRRGIMNKGH